MANSPTVIIDKERLYISAAFVDYPIAKQPLSSVVGEARTFGGRVSDAEVSNRGHMIAEKVVATGLV